MKLCLKIMKKLAVLALKCWGYVHSAVTATTWKQPETWTLYWTCWDMFELPQPENADSMIFFSYVFGCWNWSELRWTFIRYVCDWPFGRAVLFVKVIYCWGTMALERHQAIFQILTQFTSLTPVRYIYKVFLKLSHQNLQFFNPSSFCLGHTKKIK